MSVLLFRIGHHVPDDELHEVRLQQHFSTGTKNLQRTDPAVAPRFVGDKSKLKQAGIKSGLSLLPFQQQGTFAAAGF
ncbi:MAG: hypothetical protein IBX50_12345, partial [Marinospirillum sp.]|uniref:hypothetical protein n=1 Tax=Marinospirillum sp. TaxID=2183934 RepID=UPI0019FFF9A1